MTSVAAWASMMRQSLTIEPVVSLDRANVPTYGSPETVQCRLVWMQEQVLGGSGQQVLSKGVAWLRTSQAVREDSRVTLSTADTGSTESAINQPKLLRVDRFPDESGWHHVKLWFA